MVCSPAFSGVEHDARREDGEVVVHGDAAENVRPVFVQSFSSNPIRLGQDWTK